jgi:hypothetical protein
LFATVIDGLLRQLDVSVGASGPHDFAVRFSAIRHRRIRVHRIPPHVRDDRETPLRGGGTESQYSCFYLGVKLNSEIQKLVRVLVRDGFEARRRSSRAVIVALGPRAAENLCPFRR